MGAARPIGNVAITRAVNNSTRVKPPVFAPLPVSLRAPIRKGCPVLPDVVPPSMYAGPVRWISFPPLVLSPGE